MATRSGDREWCAVGVERERVDAFGSLESGLRQASPWYLWGPYLSERQWGTVREDYSADGEAWNHLPHDHARSRAYRWGEDGLAGFSDVEQRLCLALALWNGRDPILKERIYGLTGTEGNHGEDAKEYWWYLDAVPSHAWNRWRYHYPQRAFPYEDLRTENARRGRLDPEYELLDTGAFDEDRYWVVEVHYAKADPTDLLMTVEITNAGPDADVLHVLPTLWFRNTWSWDPGTAAPVLAATAGTTVAVTHPFLGELELAAGRGPDGSDPTLLFCDNDTNTARLYGQPGPAYPKDGINDHVTAGAPTVNPERVGSRCAAWYRVPVEPGETVELRLRLHPAGSPADLDAGFERTRAQRRAEADGFYTELTPEAAGEDEANVMRQAFAGMLWSKQLYYYDVNRWLDGDPGLVRPPASRRTGRNARWRTFSSFDIMSMPDKWEYPWFAAWDMAFHCVALAHVDPSFAKYQLTLLCREWFQHPNGALPAYEWDFGDVNPPVQAWSALEVF
ncbi:MAG: glucosidase, partial [Pseudonocardia sp.]